VNKTEKNKERAAYSKFDEKSEQQRISEIAVEKIELNTLLNGSNIKYNDISYCFNNSNSGFFFFFLKDGRFITINLDKKDKDDFHFTSRIKSLSASTNIKPLTSCIVPNGCVIEYYDQVILYQNSGVKIIESNPAINVRTYPTSIRYRNIITVTKESEISIHSIFPEKIKLPLDFTNGLY